MTWTVIDDFSDTTLWSALQPNNTPSSELILANDTAHYRYLPDATSLRLHASATATGHFISRSVGSLDLSDFTEIRFWFRTTSESNGGVEQPFRLRLQLGSAALPIGSPGNTWHRYLAAPQRLAWQFVRLATNDLDPQVADAVTELRLTCVNAMPAWTAWLDDFIACRPDMIADVSAAFAGLLHQQLIIGTPVPALVHIPGMPEPTAPWFRIVLHDVSYSGERTTGPHARTDFVDVGYRVRQRPIAYDLHYTIEAVASDLTAQATMLEFLIDTLGHQRTLLVNGAQLPLDRVKALPEDVAATAPLLRYRAATTREPGPAAVVTPVTEAVLAGDLDALNP